MIIVDKPYCYLRDKYEWGYRNRFTRHRRYEFMDPAHIMGLEPRDIMTCKIFSAGHKKTKEAEYIAITLEDFLLHSNIENDLLYCQYSPKSAFCFVFIKIGLKVIRNAEICLPTKEDFPLIIRNEKYNFYIAPRVF